jgi:DNA repair protein RecN (Recombination protein N)
MLVELLVENLAVVERARVRFHPGLNLLTGETGSGKSLVVDALGLLFGDRASAGIVRSGADCARVSAVFEIAGSEALAELLAQAGVEAEENELLVEREVFAEGKSRAFAGSRPVTAGFLRSLAPFLGDIHGQHEQQRLFASEAQLELLDAFAGAAALLEETASLHRQWRKAGEELARLEAAEQETLRLADLWSFQRKEIEEIAPRPGEDSELDNERRVLGNVARLEAAIAGAHEALYESDGAALGRIRHAWRSLDEACRIDGRLAAVRDTLQPAEVAVEEAAHELRHYLGRLEADPARLEQVESRLAALDRLKRKYGSSLDEVLRYLDEVRANLAARETSGERRAALKQEHERVAALYESAAARLSRERAGAAGRMAKQLERELASLALERTVFRIALEKGPWSATGADRVAFLVSPNPGEEPRPLDRVASGGELSRIALALKTCAAGSAAPAPGRQPAPRTLVFDEVDAGVGGAAAETVGRRLKQIAAANQVLCVTHLPQIAAFADHHYLVEKRESKGRTLATVEEIPPAERVREIGRMLSGRQLTPEALRHAEQLIKLARG